MNGEKTFPAKLLLFGEYSILLGSPALSMPFRAFGAAMRFIDHDMKDKLGTATESNSQLKKLCSHFLENPEVFGEFFDHDRFSKELANGLYLSSTIPQSYGMGSSGALCAAIYSRFGIDKKEPGHTLSGDDLKLLRHRFSRMESFFHGRSSGFDPLVSYLNRPLLLGKDGATAVTGNPGHLFPDSNSGLFLVDTGSPYSTGSLVGDFLDRYAPAGKTSPAGAAYGRMTNSCITTFLQGNPVRFREEINRLSRFQLKALEHLIPGHFNPIWREGLLTGLFTLKLCGSGGGGYLLCFTRDNEQTARFFEKRKIPVIQVPLL